MPAKREELTEAQKTERQISAMGDSVDLINRLIAEGKHTEQVHDTIDRNVRHLEIMLDKDNIKGAGQSLKAFTDAVTAGKDYIKAPVVEG
jgi:hypothetical protein